MGPNSIQRNPASVIWRSPFPNGPPALEIQIEVLTERGTNIHQLAAQKASQDLEDSRGWAFDDANKIPDVQDLAKREGVRLGETFQVANKWCSFVAISPDDGKEISIQYTICQPNLPSVALRCSQYPPPQRIVPRVGSLYTTAPLQATRIRDSKSHYNE